VSLQYSQIALLPLVALKEGIVSVLIVGYGTRRWPLEWRAFSLHMRVELRHIELAPGK